ncbi:hypothetical protein ABTI49_04290 [Acinetobacter baumannii]|uniref:hypothetical protein n=1 Tax=Acinetobacter baumannii TaxID=470 RepID=UPI000571B24E|nr:hypothetical protein [Acinetobacter baumannii]ATI40458.1 hypothetical protein BS103_18020 [Acinetobacter baumannii]MCZ3110602.1 hypothetical protein [Acinetobacter baumannii]MCZ3323456.1 hypothetical protein [Acinetobacter baumannii]MDA3575058.1 hypothetical protein [Acinetobacter baumannii]MDE3318522.1 hypothetical protein [Acinetobacter baumannii]
MPIGIEIKDDTGEVVLNSESKVLVKAGEIIWTAQDMTSNNWVTGAYSPVTGKYQTLFVAPYKLAKDDQINWWHANDDVIFNVIAFTGKDPQYLKGVFQGIHQGGQTIYCRQYTEALAISSSSSAYLEVRNANNEIVWDLQTFMNSPRILKIGTFEEMVGIDKWKANVIPNGVPGKMWIWVDSINFFWDNNEGGDTVSLPQTKNFLLACFKDSTLYLQQKSAGMGDDPRTWLTTIFVGYMPT